MLSEIFIDYLQYSIDERYIPSGVWKISPVQNYKAGYKDTTGIRYYVGNALTKKALVVMSGEPLIQTRNDGLTDSETIRLALERGGIISRIDMTCDIYLSDNFLLPTDFVNFWRQGKVVSKHAEHEPKFIGSVTQSGNEIETLNFGGGDRRAKHGMVRVYDKGLDLGLERFLITRIEVEDKRKYAQKSAERILDYGIAPTLKTRFDVMDDTFNEALGTSVAPTHRGIAKLHEVDEITRRWDWLFNQVAPSLGVAAKHDADNGRFDRFEEFIRIVEDHMKPPPDRNDDGSYRQ